jgi:CheY-like chemotaxis protein
MTAARKLVLIVEDSSDCAETLQIAFESLTGVDVAICSSARNLWPVLESERDRIGAIVTDLHLTETDGLDIIRRIRLDGRLSKIPIMLVSGDSDPRIAEMALSSGASAYFAKPYSPSAVRKKLEELLCDNDLAERAS